LPQLAPAREASTTTTRALSVPIQHMPNVDTPAPGGHVVARSLSSATPWPFNTDAGMPWRGTPERALDAPFALGWRSPQDASAGSCRGAVQRMIGVKSSQAVSMTLTASAKKGA